MIVVVAALVLGPAWAARRARGRRTADADGASPLQAATVALGVEFAFLAVLLIALSTGMEFGSEFSTGTRLATFGGIFAIPLLVGGIMAWARPRRRVLTLARTSAIVLAIELIVPVVGLLIYGGSCFGGYGYVEF